MIDMYDDAFTLLSNYIMAVAYYVIEVSSFRRYYNIEFVTHEYRLILLAYN